VNRALAIGKLGTLMLLSLLIVGAIRVLERVETTLDHLDDALFDVRNQLSQVTGQTTTTLASVSSAVNVVHDTVQESRRPLAKILLHTDATVGRTAITMQRVEAMASGLQAQQSALNEQQAQLFTRGFRLFNTADGAVQNLSHLAADADVLVLNPDIKLTLASVRELADNSNQTMSHVNHTATSFDAYVQRLLKPASTLKQIGRTALGFSEGVVAHAIP